MDAHFHKNELQDNTFFSGFDTGAKDKNLYYYMTVGKPNDSAQTTYGPDEVNYRFFGI